MANRKSSWQERRWKLFELEYASNVELRIALSNILETTDRGSAFYLIESAITAHGVPRYCTDAVRRFLYDPELPRNEYLRHIIMPIAYWGAESVKLGPGQGIPTAHYLTFLLGMSGIKATRDGKEVSGTQLAKAIAQDSTIIQLEPYLTKTEVHELIDECWDELEPLIHEQNPHKDSRYGAKLLSRVQPTRASRVQERDDLIMQLHEQGMNDTEIATYLVEQTNHTKLQVDYIRVIRHRNRGRAD